MKIYVISEILLSISEIIRIQELETVENNSPRGSQSLSQSVKVIIGSFIIQQLKTLD